MKPFHILVLLLSVQQVRAQQPGDLDTSFAVGGKLVLEDHTGAVEEINYLSEGMMLFMVWDGSISRILRRHYDGSSDSTFATDGTLLWPRHTRRMLVDGSGRIYLVGNTNTQGIVERYLSSGDLDSTYSSNGTVMLTFTDTSDFNVMFHDADVYPDGRLIISGGTDLPDGSQASGLRSMLFRLSDDGQLDETFMNGGMVIFYGQINYGINPTYGTPCTSHLRYSCPLVRIGHMQEIYLARQKMWWHNCSPSGRD